MPNIQHKYLRPEDLKRLANYRFAVQMMVEGWMSGKHRAKGRGASSDFLEYRQYAPGDDLRLIDWRVYARSDRYHLKTFEHETHLECHIFVDSSASMGYRSGGPMTKLDYASYFAACVAWLVIRGNDRASLQTFDADIRSFMPPGSTRKHLDGMLNLLEHNTPGGPTSLPASLEKSHHLLKTPGTLVIVSDFLSDPAALMQSLNPYLHRGFKIVLVQVLDPHEVELPSDGLARYYDMETNEHLLCNSETVRSAYRQRVQEHRAGLRSLAMSRGIRFFSVTTDESYYQLFDALSE